MTTSRKLAYLSLALFVLSLLLPAVYYNLGNPNGSPIGYKEGGFDSGWNTLLAVILGSFSVVMLPSLHLDNLTTQQVFPLFMFAATVANIMVIVSPWLIQRNLGKWFRPYSLIGAVTMLCSVWGWTLLNNPLVERCTISDMEGIIEPCYAYGTFVWISAYCVWLFALFHKARELRTIKN